MRLRPRQKEILATLGIPVWKQRIDTPQASASTDTEKTTHPSAPATRATSENPSRWAPEVRISGLPEQNAVPSSRSFPPAAALQTPDTDLDWESLEQRVRHCTRCSDLVTHRKQIVFGTGDRAAQWMLIGEAPGAEEDRQGQPFVGRSGQLLDRMLLAIGLERGQNVYIANVIKCRPPGNRNPTASESNACRGYLERQVALVQPQIILALGRVAAQALLNTGDSLAMLRGRVHTFGTIPVVVTYHPAYLLRFPLEKGMAWQDLCRARELMQSAVSSSRQPSS